MRITASIIAGLLVLLLFWLGGYDFDERGFVAINAAVWSLFAAGMAFFFPYWNTDKPDAQKGQP